MNRLFRVLTPRDGAARHALHVAGLNPGDTVWRHSVRRTAVNTYWSVSRAYEAPAGHWHPHPATAHNMPRCLFSDRCFDADEGRVP